MDVELVKHYGLSKVQLVEMQKIVAERKDELIHAWFRHFGDLIDQRAHGKVDAQVIRTS